MVFTDRTETYGLSLDPVLWDFGDGAQQFGSPAMHGYSVTGVDTVELEMHVAGCPFSVRAPVPHGDTNDDCSVAIDPSFDFNQSANNTTTFTNGTVAGAITLTPIWYFGDGGLFLGADPSHMYVYPGSYTAVLAMAGTDMSTQDGCTAGMVRTLLVDGNASTCDSSLFLDMSYTLSDGYAEFSAVMVASSGLQVLDLSWDFGDASSAITSLPTPAHYYLFPGAYQTCLHVNAMAADSCMATVCRTLNIATAAAGVGDMDAPGPLFAWPIPFRDVLMIDGAMVQGRTRIDLLDVLCRTLRTWEVSGPGPHQLSTAGLAGGPYFLRAHGPAGTSMLRILHE